ncbi:MAG TPA: hypothetical protein EYP08_04690 [Pyrodictiaceae archaeon]|nr:hypothetical protein [Pyrodictiaceae archaeon]HIQ55226.1 hypothetical protein [Pyrodictium sp.]
MVNEVKTDEQQVNEKITPKKKIDVRAALQFIPPASQLASEKRRAVVERRVRLRFHNELKESIVKLNPDLARELDVKDGDYIEVVVAHRHKFVYKVELDENVPVTEVWVNGEKLPEYGVSDNSIATIRKARR